MAAGQCQIALNYSSRYLTQVPPLLGSRSREPFPQIKIYHYTPDGHRGYSWARLYWLSCLSDIVAYRSRAVNNFGQIRCLVNEHRWAIFCVGWCFVNRKNCFAANMWFMYILSWVAMIIQICFVTLAIGKFCINDDISRFNLSRFATYWAVLFYTGTPGQQTLWFLCKCTWYAHIRVTVQKL